ncbi:hypothetical protein IDAT_12965 [Pseudidiomarina atlantica]|uniref:Uncharacterized protein n=1 Tax=Pseudidiomarina atlantica TaxID=1517416 RepID=A0A094IKQ2_9GAMM|nr:hypothetical protein [Pseudidiomarina atlantica]KFZ27757.1 hypothetical protein IDAT_12965 [Pseudidiomarina atlantica]
MRKGLLLGLLTLAAVPTVQAGALGAIGQVQTETNGAVTVDGWWCAPERQLATAVVLGPENASLEKPLEMLAVIRGQRLARSANHPACPKSKLYQTFQWTINTIEAQAFAGSVIQAQVNYADGRTLVLAGDFVLGATPQLQAQSQSTLSLSQVGSGVTFVHQDLLGSVIAETQSNRTVMQQTKYLPFGKSEDY